LPQDGFVQLIEAPKKKQETWIEFEQTEAPGCVRSVDRFIERIGENYLGNIENTSSCFKTKTYDNQVPPMLLAEKEECTCGFDFVNEKTRQSMIEEGYVQVTPFSRGSVEWAEKSEKLPIYWATQRGPKQVWFDSDIPIRDELEAQKIVQKLEERTKGNCKLDEIHRHPGTAHYHIRCTNKESLDTLSDSIGELIATS
jgi:hypothetical protein